MGRNKLPQGEKKVKVDVFVKVKTIENIGYKRCAEIAVTAIEEEYLKFDKLPEAGKAHLMLRLKTKI